MNPEILVDHPYRIQSKELDFMALSDQAWQVIESARSRVNELAADQPDLGYYQEGSTLRMVHRCRSVGLSFGQLGLLMGSTDAINFVGTAEHTQNRDRPFARLATTAKMFETIFFASRKRADKVGDIVFEMHKDVNGYLAEAVGPYTAGTPYAALDPDRLLWTLACIAYPAVSLYETFERPLSNEEREEIWQDYLLFGELFGLSRDDAPEDYADFQHYMKNRLTSGELYLTEPAKYMGEQVCFNTPIPFATKPFRQFMNLVLRGMLPEEIREMYDIPHGKVEEAVFKVAVIALRTGKFLPDFLTKGDNTMFFKLVAQQEESLEGSDSHTVMPCPYSH